MSNKIEGDTMSKRLWYVDTEEGIVGTGCETPLEALVEYIELSEVTEEYIDQIIAGKSEINHVVAYTREEHDALPES